jgi:hypothetical protein
MTRLETPATSDVTQRKFLFGNEEKKKTNRKQLPKNLIVALQQH